METYKFLFQGIDHEFAETYHQINDPDGSLEETEEYLESDFWYDNHTLQLNGGNVLKFYNYEGTVFCRFLDCDFEYQQDALEELITQFINSDPDWIRLGANASPFRTGDEIDTLPDKGYIIAERAGYVTAFWHYPLEDVELSGTWMSEHIDVWSSEFGPAPTGDYFDGGEVWRGTITLKQKRELLARATMYAGDEGYKAVCPDMVEAAEQVVKALT